MMIIISLTSHKVVCFYFIFFIKIYKLLFYIIPNPSSLNSNPNVDAYLNIFFVSKTKLIYSFNCSAGRINKTVCFFKLIKKHTKLAINLKVKSVYIRQFGIDHPMLDNLKKP